MLNITLSATDDHEAVELHFEHSLVSISKWESIHEKAFFGREPMTPESTVSYVQLMLLDPPPHPEWVNRLEVDDFKRITEYINSRQTATWFREDSNQAKNNEVVTSELVYYWMIQFQIPFTCEYWHFNRLMTLIKICGVKQAKPKKMSKAAQAEEMRRLNAARRQQLGTSG